jgi:hypothetical protein
MQTPISRSVATSAALFAALTTLPAPAQSAPLPFSKGLVRNAGQ